MDANVTAAFDAFTAREAAFERRIEAAFVRCQAAARRVMESVPAANEATDRMHESIWHFRRMSCMARPRRVTWATVMARIQDVREIATFQRAMTNEANRQKHRFNALVRARREMIRDMRRFTAAVDQAVATSRIAGRDGA